MFISTKRVSVQLVGVLPKTVNLLLICVIVLSQNSSALKSKILLRDIETLTFFDGRYTEHRRVPPVEQLKCVGGTAANYKRYIPHSVQCYNRGFDGKDVQWKCNADLSKDVRFGYLDVNCEGYDHSEDRYVLIGSCALRYKLDFTEGSSVPRMKKPAWLPSSFGFLSNLLDGFVPVIVFVVIVFALWYFCIRDVSEPEVVSMPRAEPSAPPYSHDPPSYDDAMRGDRSSYAGESARFRGPSSTSDYGWNLGGGNPSSWGTTFRNKSYWPRSESNGPSYWATGASAFAGSFLGSTLFGSRSGSSRSCDFDPPPRHTGRRRDPDRSSSGERDSYEATGYATTSRR